MVIVLSDNTRKLLGITEEIETMKHQVWIEDDVYDYLGVQADLFESVSDVLRKLLDIDEIVAESKPRPVPGRRKTSMRGYKFKKTRCNVCHRLISSNAFHRHLAGAPHKRALEAALKKGEEVAVAKAEVQEAVKKESIPLPVPRPVVPTRPPPQPIVPKKLDRAAKDLITCEFCEKRFSPQAMNLHVMRGHVSKYDEYREIVRRRKAGQHQN